jgi:hypothetical protein
LAQSHETAFRVWAVASREAHIARPEMNAQVFGTGQLQIAIEDDCHFYRIVIDAEFVLAGFSRQA